MRSILRKVLIKEVFITDVLCFQTMTSNANNWTVDDVSRWLRNIGYERYVTFFAQNNISGDVLLSLNNEHLFQLVKCFGDIFKLGDVLKFRNQLMELKSKLLFLGAKMGFYTFLFLF